MVWVTRILQPSRYLSGPTDIPAVLNRASIDYVSVHDRRVLAIYQTAIFNVTTDPAQIRTHKHSRSNAGRRRYNPTLMTGRNKSLFKTSLTYLTLLRAIESITSIARPD